ncbi:MAG: hypothetical protein EXR71_12230 [Myxococcales bacterium]|nr:hypothetical protein [Myxococcales bacterium]
MRPMLLLATAVFFACDGEDHLTAADRVLDGFSYVDAGAVAVNDRQVFTVPLFSKGSQVRIFEIEAEDVTVPEGAVSPAFLVDDSTWADACDADADGIFDCRDLAKYTDDSDDDTLPLQVVFAPTVKGYYEALLTIWSNDNTSSEVAALPGDETREWAIWRVQLRGLSDYACGRIYPDYIDFGPRNVGGDFSTAVILTNCGIVPVTVADIQIVGDGMESRTLPPLTVLAGRAAEVSIGWRVPSSAAVDGVLSFVSNSEALGTAAIRVVGNSCENSLGPASWDDDFDGWPACGGDCDDGDLDTNPSRNEFVGDGLDNDCDGEIDELGDDSVNDDDDEDGCSEAGAECGGIGDCDDNDPLVGPDAEEVHNLRDDDCDALIDEGTEAYDDDGDGWNELEGDCDDTDPLVSLTGVEIVDGRDNDCNGTVDEGGPAVDDDRDSFKDVEPDLSQNDCDDEDPWVFTGAREYCDGYDNDCDGLVDDGEADEVDGACHFQPSRSTEGTGQDTGEAKAGGCATAGLGLSLFGAVAGLVLVRPRRRAYR